VEEWEGEGEPRLLEATRRLMVSGLPWQGRGEVAGLTAGLATASWLPTALKADTPIAGTGPPGAPMLATPPPRAPMVSPEGGGGRRGGLEGRRPSFPVTRDILADHSEASSQHNSQQVKLPELKQLSCFFYDGE